MAKGGKRPGAGRKPGSRTKTKANRELAIAMAGVTPKQFLLNGMAFYQRMIDREAAKGKKADEATILAAYAGGREYAKDAAPYCHARLASHTHSGQINSTVEVRDARERLALLLAGEATARTANGASQTTH